MFVKCWCCKECSSVLIDRNSEKTKISPNINKPVSNAVFVYDEDHPFSHMMNVLSYHKSYVKTLQETHNFLLHGDGPLSYEFRFYIGILSSARHQCTYLTEVLTSEFKYFKCNLDWLEGIDHCPQKLKDIYQVIKILAHRPWLLTSQHIEELTKTGSNNWSISEVTQAIVLISFFHALSSFVCSCGIDVEETTEDLPINKYSENSFETDSVADLIEKMRLVAEDATNDVTPEERLKRFTMIDRDNNKQCASIRLIQNHTQYLLDPTYVYEKYLSDINEPPLQTQDFSWADQGFPLANTFYTDVAEILDKEFHIAKDLTYNYIGTCDGVDTTAFRCAIWNYTQSIFGIYHDDYDYEEINRLLDKNLRTFIKTVTCFPESLKKSEFDSYLKDCLPSEKVHISILIYDAKLQSLLLYGLKSISKFHSSNL